MRTFLSLGCAVFCLSALAKAGLIEADFVRAELPPNSTTITTPIFLGPDGDVSSDGLGTVSDGQIVFLKFKIPDIADVVSIDEFDFFVTVYDDADGGGESGDIDFAQPGNNIQFLDTFTSLNHTTPGSPETIEIQLTQDLIDQLFPTITDGTFRIRVSRDTGDFYVAPTGSAIIDGVLSSDTTSTPEPSSVSVMAAGLCAVAGLLFARKRSSARA